MIFKGCEAVADDLFTSIALCLLTLLKQFDLCLIVDLYMRPFLPSVVITSVYVRRASHFAVEVIALTICF